MASIWIHRPGNKAPEKLEGNLIGRKAIARLHHHAMQIAANEDAKLYWLHELEGRLVWGDKEGFIFLEAYSPSSKPEVGQPRHWGDTGVILRRDGTVKKINNPVGWRA